MMFQVRVYVIKAFQITPGGLEREEAGKKVWEHIVTADLGEVRMFGQPNVRACFRHVL